MSNQTKRMLWEERIQLQQQSGQSVTAWCWEQGLVPATFWYWKRQLQHKEKTIRQETEPVFAPLPITLSNASITIKSEQFLIEISDECNPVLLKSFMEVLKNV